MYRLSSIIYRNRDIARLENNFIPAESGKGYVVYCVPLCTSQQTVEVRRATSRGSKKWLHYTDAEDRQVNIYP